MAEAMNQTGKALGKAQETGESPNRRTWLRFRDNRPAMVASVFLLGLIVLALAWPLISSQGDVHSEAQFAAPNAGHWFGTDVHGRDLFGRVLAGARLSVAHTAAEGASPQSARVCPCAAFQPCCRRVRCHRLEPPSPPRARGGWGVYSCSSNAASHLASSRRR